MPTSPTSKSRKPQEVQRPQQRPATAPPAAQGGDAAAAAAVAGTAGGLASAPALAAPAAGAAVTMATVLATLGAFFPKLRLRQQAWLGQRIRSGAIPGATDQDVLEALALENELQTEFESRVRSRVVRDLDGVLSDPDVTDKKERVAKVFERERRYTMMRSVEMGRRMEKSVERAVVRRESPRGAFWELGPAKEHTPECVAMSGKFWSWVALDLLRPPVGPGCRCSLRSEKDAIVAGKLGMGQTPRGAAAVERILIIHGRHHGGVQELREAILKTGLADEETVELALLRWAAEAVA